MSSAARRRIVHSGLVLACAAACEPKLVVGRRVVEEPSCELPGAGGAGTNPEDKVVEVPWSTGFENGFCDYRQALGYCYKDPDATQEIVGEPVYSGRSAAAFGVTSALGLNGAQTRCFLEGSLPVDAVYGAWFYLPALAESTANWNLVHFQGGMPSALSNLWDVSLGIAGDGSAFLYVRDFLNGSMNRVPEPAPAVPVGEWFHVEFRLRRAADATGTVALYQDGVLLLEVTDIVTDNTTFGQWYVGNLVALQTPSESMLYVDDVSIRAAP